MKPLAIDLCCGLGGWADGLLAEGFAVVGFDIERHQYGEHRYPAQLVIQDVLTLHGSQFRDAALIVASPPCQAYSYRAMPWSRAKALPPPCNALFEACFRIQREASEAAGRRIPLIVENVRGAQPWVGRARWNFGSYYLWGDVPALMPITVRGRLRLKTATGEQWNVNRPNFTGSQVWAGSGRDEAGHKVPGFRFDGSGGSFQTASVETTGHKSQGMNWSDRTIKGQDFTRIAGRQAIEGTKLRDADGYERDHPDAFGWKGPRTSSRAITARKAASAMIARIPLPLARHIAATFRPEARP
jgi:hypothetical protein